MKFPEEFVNEMNDFFSRYKYVPQEGFYESFEKEPLKGIRFSRTKINSEDEEKQLLKDLGEGENPVSWCSGGYYINNAGAFCDAARTGNGSKARRDRS